MRYRDKLLNFCGGYVMINSQKKHERGNFDDRDNVEDQRDDVRYV